MAMKQCPDCGEKYSDTYKKCPFCDEAEKIKKGKRVQKRPTKNGGRRAGNSDKENILTLILLVIMLVLAGILLWLLFGGGSSDDLPDDPSSTVGSSSTEKPENPGTSTDKPENPGTSNPGQMPGVEIDPPKPLVPTADEIKLLPQTLKLNKEDYTTNVGDAPVQLKVGTGTGTYTWVSADPAIASVDANGKVTAVANGNVWVYATDGVGMGKCIVRVKGGSAPVRPNPGDPVTPSTPTTPSDPSAANAKLNREDMTLAVGDYFAMKVKNYDGEVTWSVKDPSIASILNDGTVKALKSGRTTITAKVGDRTLECIVRVKN